jgi:hypothetical protein
MGICITPQGCLVEALDSVWGGFADAARQAAGEMLTTAFGWWTASPSTGVDTAVLHTAQRFVTSWLALPVAVLALIAVVGWGVASGGDGWIRDAVRGLLVFGIAAAGSIPIVAALQAWSESLARGLLTAVPTGDIGARYLTMLDLPGTTPLAVTFWTGLLFLAGAVQYLLMLFRDGAVLLLTVLLPVAAAGQFSRGSIMWLPKVGGWLLAFVFMKPAAALVYFLGLSLLGQATGVQAIATGVALMVAAVLALPVLLRLVTFAVDAAPLHTNVLASAATVAGVAASGAQLIASRSGRGSGAPATGATGAAGAVGPAGAAVATGAVVADAGLSVARATTQATSQALDPDQARPTGDTR